MYYIYYIHPGSIKSCTFSNEELNTSKIAFTPFTITERERKKVAHNRCKRANIPRMYFYRMFFHPLCRCICNRCHSTSILITFLTDLTAYRYKIYRFVAKATGQIEYIGLHSRTTYLFQLSRH